MASLALRIAPILANGTTFGAWRSPVSALVWETRGRRFKSSRSDHFFKAAIGGLIVGVERLLPPVTHA